MSTAFLSKQCCQNGQFMRNNARRFKFAPVARRARLSLLGRSSLVTVCGQKHTHSVGASEDKKSDFWGDAAKNAVKTVAVCGLAAALALSTVSPAEAARSGGRAGGSHFSSHRSSMRSSSSSGSGYSMPGRTSSYSRGAVYSAPSVTYMPSFFVSPFGLGYGYSSGSSLFTLLALAMFAFVAIQAFSMFSSSAGDNAYAAEEAVTVAKVQVGLLGMARTLKRDLDSIATKVDTSDPRGLSMLLQETVLALLRNPDYYVYGGCTVEQLRDGEAAERVYNRTTMEERSKFREETLSNVGGITRRRDFNKREDGVNELLVVTMVVAAEGSFSLPPVRTSADLRSCLNTLGGLAPSQVIGVELMWTPQAEGDFYTRDEVIADYPNLVPL